MEKTTYKFFVKLSKDRCQSSKEYATVEELGAALVKAIAYYNFKFTSVTVRKDVAVWTDKKEQA